eukprot:16427438-Heterocapsa_arctica.AAC.1
MVDAEPFQLGDRARHQALAHRATTSPHLGRHDRRAPSTAGQEGCRKGRRTSGRGKGSPRGGAEADEVKEAAADREDACCRWLLKDYGLSPGWSRKAMWWMLYVCKACRAERLNVAKPAFIKEAFRAGPDDPLYCKGWFDHPADQLPLPSEALNTAFEVKEGDNWVQ